MTLLIEAPTDAQLRYIAAPARSSIRLYREP